MIRPTPKFALGDVVRKVKHLHTTMDVGTTYAITEVMDFNVMHPTLRYAYCGEDVCCWEDELELVRNVAVGSANPGTKAEVVQYQKLVVQVGNRFYTGQLTIDSDGGLRVVVDGEEDAV